MISTVQSLPQAPSRPSRPSRPVVLVAFAAVLAGGLVGCGGGTPSPPSPIASPPEPTALMQNVRFEGFRSGERDLVVFARTAEIVLSSREVALEHVRVEAQGSEGEISIAAEQGTVDLEEDSFRLIGKVKGRVGTGQRFETSEVRYDSSTQKIWTDREVRVVRDNLTLVGKGMDLDLKERRVQILNGVRTTLEGEGP